MDTGAADPAEPPAHPARGAEGAGTAAGPPPARWGLGDAAAGMVVGVLLSSSVASIWLGVSGAEKLSLGGLALGQLGLWTGLAGSVVLASRRKGSADLGVDFGWRLRPVDLLIGVAVALLAHAFLDQVVVRLLGPLLDNPDISEPVEELVDAARGLRIVGLLLFVSVGAPVVEELFFRGLLLRSLQRRFSDRIAVPLASVLFGLAHVQALSAAALVLVIVSLILLGLALAFLAVRTGRLGPGMVAHSAFNAFSVVAVLAE